MEPVKRRTVHIFDKFLDAWHLNNWLRKQGVDTKIVSKHAVQIHPKDEEKVQKILSQYK